MRYTVIRVLVPDSVVILQSFRNVVGVQEREFRRVCKSVAAKHLDVRPRDDENRCRTPWRSRDSLDSLLTTSWDHGMARKEWGQMFSNTDWSMLQHQHIVFHSSKTVHTQHQDHRLHAGYTEAIRESKLYGYLTLRSHGESLVQVQVANIAAAYCWVRQADLSVQVGTYAHHGASLAMSYELFLRTGVPSR